MNKIKFFITAIALILFSNLGISQTFHAIIFADTNDEKIGKSVMEDLQNIATLMSMIHTENSYMLKEYYYWGNDCNNANLTKVLQNLLCNQEDVVFFYYSGHGTRSLDDNSKFPQMCLGSKSEKDYMPLYRVEEIIAKKNPKFRIIMADCCNSFSPYVSPKSDYGKGKTVIKSESATALKTLFGQTEGSIIVASSKAGETSVAWEEGGAFTYCFIFELLKMIEGTSSPVVWNTLLENTRTTALNATTGRMNTGQTSIFNINIDHVNINNETEIDVPRSNNPFISALIKMADNGGTELNRINMAQPTLTKYFISPKAIVETYSQNGRTMLSRETALEFLERVGTSYKLINFSIIPTSQTDANGKYIYLKIKEIYKQ